MNGLAISARGWRGIPDVPLCVNWGIRGGLRIDVIDLSLVAALRVFMGFSEQGGRRVLEGQQQKEEKCIMTRSVDDDGAR
jgi:hypothetical protein